MKYQHNTNFYVLRPRPITWVVLVLIGIAGWGNAQYWVGYYSRVGVALSIADYACFSQRVSLIPPLVVPLMMSHHGLSTPAYMRSEICISIPRAGLTGGRCAVTL